jgi:hypothetical protein
MRDIGKSQSKWTRIRDRNAPLTPWAASSASKATVTSTQDRTASTCPKRLLIEARWGSQPLAFAGKLLPRRLIKKPFWTHALGGQLLVLRVDDGEDRQGAAARRLRQRSRLVQELTQEARRLCPRPLRLNIS